MIKFVWVQKWIQIIMATVNFKIRSNKTDKLSSIYIRFKDSTLHDIQICVDYLKCKPSLFKSGKCKDPNYSVDKDSKLTLNIQLEEIRSRVLKNYLENKNQIDDCKKWLSNQIYLDNSTNKDYDDINNFINVFLDYKKSNIKTGSFKRYNTVFKKFRDFLSKNNSGINPKFSTINASFMLEVENYFREFRYTPATLTIYLRAITELYKFAESKGVNVNNNVYKWKQNKSIKEIQEKFIYLDFKELKTLTNLELSNQKLEIARDWLLISCFTGQRVSDFLNFNKDNIVRETEGSFLKFKQVKTDKIMYIPILEQVEQVLNKRDGDFPPTLKTDEYNLLIKEVCKIAGFDELMKGKLHKKGLAGRKIENYYPKHKLVSSHIGRRSFATNYYRKLNNQELMYVTGHASVKQFLNYIQKTDEELGMDIARKIKIIKD